MKTHIKKTNQKRKQWEVYYSLPSGEAFEIGFYKDIGDARIARNAFKKGWLGFNQLFRESI